MKLFKSKSSSSTKNINNSSSSSSEDTDKPSSSAVLGHNNNKKKTRSSLFSSFSSKKNFNKKTIVSNANVAESSSTSRKSSILATASTTTVTSSSSLYSSRISSSAAPSAIRRNPFDNNDGNNGDDDDTYTTATPGSTSSSHGGGGGVDPFQHFENALGGEGEGVDDENDPRNNPFEEGGKSSDVDDDDADDAVDDSSSSLSSSMKTLQGIMNYLKEKELKEWAAEIDHQRRIANALSRNTKNWYVATADDNDDIVQQQQADADDIDSDDEELLTDVVEAILHAMEDYPDDEILQEDSCLALEAFTTTTMVNNNNNAINVNRILEEILVAMEGFADNPIVVSSSLGLLCNLSTTTTSSSSKGGGGVPGGVTSNPKLAKYALSSILQGMKEHRDDVELYTKGCKAMSNFTQNNHTAQLILTCKEPLGLRIISEGLKCHRPGNDDDIVIDDEIMLQRLKMRSSATQVVKNLSTHPSLEVKGKIALGGGAAQLIDRLLENLKETGKDLIQNNYNVAVMATTNDDDDEDDDEVRISITIMEDTLQTIGNLATIDTIVTKDDDPRYRNNHHSPTSYNNNNNNSSAADDIQKQLTKAVKPVLNVIRQHPNRRTIQYYGLQTIQRLTISHANSIANYHGGISTLLNALSLSSSESAAAGTSTASSSSTDTDTDLITDDMIYERVLGCLCGLLSPSSNADGLDLVASFHNEDGLSTIFRCVRQYQSQRLLLENAFELLFYLSCRVRVVLTSIVGMSSTIQNGVGARAARSIETQFIQEENVFVLLGTINQYIEHENASELICQRGLGILVNIHAFSMQQKQQEQQQDVFASDGGIKLVLHVMRRHGLAVAIQEYGVGLLASILKETMMTMPTTISDVLSSSSMANKKKNANIAVSNEFINEEGISTVLAAMMIHPDHGAIQVHGCDVLIYLLKVNNGNNKYKQFILDETNAVRVINDARSYHKTNKGVQSRASVLLKTLLSSSSSPSISTAATTATSILSSHAHQAAASLFAS
ncbi:hypothetical protein FRACYDRAFT_238507 [Fragilariopsis cylindrus CCMP1102]|uniref:ARM repeat-containing protein n=1 Tax=Fragilariopsis cylindrus CCMP1102 TaxID=635003 RepID=A0A1E7FIX5_9STRA|nr:hypothetical protein FRACYDRAFT_238507 [Fragilariopsis cylindrus CCMP1102]|eukprot:OEU18074.1 hypothetical protein FRACYDRAFT_238507 [Fragilariopsis cylindrus CCMP1102]